MSVARRLLVHGCFQIQITRRRANRVDSKEELAERSTTYRMRIPGRRSKLLLTIASSSLLVFADVP